MNEQSVATPDRPLGKFEDPKITAKGETRASVPLMKATTLWFNTGTLCNIECKRCYIESSPTNDQLVYITTDEVKDYLSQIKSRKWAVEEIGFTGGEPFMNPDMLKMARASLDAGFKVLILTNAITTRSAEKALTKALWRGCVGCGIKGSPWPLRGGPSGGTPMKAHARDMALSLHRKTST